MLFTLGVFALLAFVAARQNGKQRSSLAAIILALLILLPQVGPDGSFLALGAALLGGVLAGRLFDKVSTFFTPADPKSRWAAIAGFMKKVAFVAFIVAAVFLTLPLWG